MILSRQKMKDKVMGLLYGSFLDARSNVLQNGDSDRLL